MSIGIVKPYMIIIFKFTEISENVFDFKKKVFQNYNKSKSVLTSFLY